MATIPAVSAYYSLLAATLGAGLALGTANVLHVAHAPSVDQQIATVSATAPIQEDDPGWDCHTMGNYVCGDPAGTHAAVAWEAWDRTQGWKRLRAATTEVRVVYVGTATRPPRVDALTEVAVPARNGNWYVFRASEPLPRHSKVSPLPL